MKTLALVLCAWVLWQQVVVDGRIEGIARSAWDSKPPCEEARQAAQSAPGLTPEQRVLVCLPDTVDPRAPKR
jgi:hypothetical protein